MGVKYGPAPTGPRYYRPRVASADLTPAEQAAVSPRVEAARERTERDRAAAAATAGRAGAARLNVAQQVEDAKAAGKPHRRIARMERNLARTQAVNARRASGEPAPGRFDEDEAAAIEAAVRAGRVTVISQGEWDRDDEERRRVFGRWGAY